LIASLAIAVAVIPATARSQDSQDVEPVVLNETGALLAENETAPDESWPIRSRPMLRRDIVAKPAPPKPEDPRDVKLRELEQRLEETERELRDSRVTKSKAGSKPISISKELRVTATGAGAADEEYKTDTERMENLEQRFRSLESQIQSGTTTGEKKKETYPTFRVTGFLQLDSAWYAQDPLNAATVGNAQDGTGFRRARLAVLGKAAPKTLYQFEMDFATAGRPSFFDNYLEQEDIPILGAVRVGQYLQPFSVDAMSGFRNLPFLERSLPFLTFVPFRRVGVMASNNSEDELTYWAVSGFRTGGFNNAPLGDSQFASDIGNVGGYSFSGRLTHLLIYEDNDEEIWHVGGAYDYSRLGADNAVGSGTPGNAGGGPAPFYQAKSTPEFGPLGQVQNSQSFGSAVNFTPTFIDTGKYEAKSFSLLGAETVYQDGAFSAQAEFMATEVESVVKPIWYTGAYVEAMYRLTGEHRPYDKKLAALKNVVPFKDFLSFGKEGGGVRGWGAFEVAGRVSYVELRNPNSLSGHYYNSATNTFNAPASTGAVGNGTLTDTTLGCTWFMTGHSKLQFNWIHAFLHNRVKGHSQADLFVSRVQVDF
jgi:phosphate-selective porin OprO/OprP